MPLIMVESLSLEPSSQVCAKDRTGSRSRTRSNNGPSSSTQQHPCQRNRRCTPPVLLFDQGDVPEDVLGQVHRAVDDLSALPELTGSRGQDVLIGRVQSGAEDGNLVGGATDRLENALGLFGNTPTRVASELRLCTRRLGRCFYATPEMAQEAFDIMPDRRQMFNDPTTATRRHTLGQRHRHLTHVLVGTDHLCLVGDIPT
jgi:hypothetical protein